MLALDELDLPHLAMETPEFAAEPFPRMEAARAHHPWLATSVVGHVVTEYQAMKELFIQDEKMRFCLDKQLETIGAADTVVGRNALRSVMGSQDERHRHLRQTYAPAFTPRHANELRPVVRAALEWMFDDQLPGGECDFHEFATWVPATALFAILGAPADRIAPVKPDLDLIGLSASLSKDLAPIIDAANLRLMSFYGDLVQDRRDNPHLQGEPDFLDMLIAARDEGKLDDEQLVVDLCIFSTGATVTGMLTFIMRLMIDRPDMYRRCADDAQFCRLVVEEALRHCSTSTAVRLTTDDVLYRDVLIPKDTILFFPFSISGRDPGSFPDGEVFDPERPVDPERRNIAFGLGRHMCIGQYIARVEMQEALQLMAQRIREPKLAGDYGWRPFFGIWGMDSLPISFVPT